VLDLGDRRPQRFRKPVPASEDRQADAVIDAALCFGHEGAPEERHQRTDLARRAFPVVAGKGVKGERRHAPVAHRRLDDSAGGAQTGMMTGAARKAARGRPPTVAIHDNGDVE
jgi:hypothetical protein